LGPQAGQAARVYYAGAARERVLGLDALFFLNGFQFFRAFAPVVPYGVLAHDMVFFELPELFPAESAEIAELGIRPTLESADLVVCTSDATRESLHRHCPGARKHSRVVPLSCASHLRLAHATPEPIEGVGRDFILNIANVSPHKGGDVMLRAFARLKQSLGEACPALVIAGVETELFRTGSILSHPLAEHIERIRAVIADEGMVVGKDLFLLGKISEGQLAWAMRNCRAVVNAALRDNGTFCLIEGGYFEKLRLSRESPTERAIRFAHPLLSGRRRRKPIDAVAWRARIERCRRRGSPESPRRARRSGILQCPLRRTPLRSTRGTRPEGPSPARRRVIDGTGQSFALNQPPNRQLHGRKSEVPLTTTPANLR
jgi:hypothetical protein